MKITVPYDFTPIALSALNHASSINDVLKGNIELLHIVAKEGDREEAESKFRELLHSLNPMLAAKLRTTIRVGTIFQDITREAESGGSQLIVMGTHGAIGLQKVLGSRAIKVITSGNTPFIITQGKGPDGAVKTVVMPVDLTKESVQIVNFASQLAHRFGAEVHIIHKPESDEWLVNKVKSNINYVKSVLSKKGIAHQVVALKGKASFAKECIEYGEKCNAKLFAIAHFTESILPQFDTFSQEMITNKPQIPVLIINAEPVGNIKGQYSFLTV